MKWFLIGIIAAIVAAYILFGCASSQRLNDDDFKTKGYFNEG